VPRVTIRRTCDRKETQRKNKKRAVENQKTGREKVVDRGTESSMTDREGAWSKGNSEMGIKVFMRGSTRGKSDLKKKKGTRRKKKGLPSLFQGVKRRAQEGLGAPPHEGNRALQQEPREKKGNFRENV